MKLFDQQSDAMVTPEECSTEVLQVVPLIMQAIRTELRNNRICDVTVPQFRALAFIDNSQSGVSLSELAEHIGLTLPSMSKMIDGLVTRRLVTRMEDPADRRRIILRLTVEGATVIEGAIAGTRAALAEQLAQLSPEQRATVSAAMMALRPLFSKEL